jgi:hypothetical protein
MKNSVRKFFTPAFVLALLFFLLHQLLQKIFHINIPFADSYLDNFLCMPILLHGLLWERKFFWKNEHYKLPFSHMAAATLLVSFISEFLFPLWSVEFVKDYFDFVFFGLGALVFAVCMNK